jgi:hypothetical protein
MKCGKRLYKKKTFLWGTGARGREGQGRGQLFFLINWD